MTPESPAEQCSYCGRANPDGLDECPICGTALISDPPASAEAGPARKSRTVAVVLALVFGPIGLVYLRAWWHAIIMIGIGIPLMLTNKAGVWLFIVARLFAAVFAYNLASQLDESLQPQRDAERLLDEAARLENVDFQSAITTYEEVVRRYPNTRAARQAASVIEVLKRNLKLRS